MQFVEIFPFESMKNITSEVAQHFLIQHNKFHEIYRRCPEKTSYVSNYACFTLLHKWGYRGQTNRLERLQ